ncbi:hypothetical protein [Edaphobacter flagellatus]|uniref:hypothetical protein n=1 Tax=Edaphobacter flagellatus TaxID=1933044 RepID=UPI0021B25AC0|nr:hypothetical protein [Edaphobacter flagellatus]
MQTEIFETPVALFVFNRPHTTRRVFEAIAKIRPARLLLIADGPRLDKAGEIDACRQVREIISRIDWPCNVSQNFADNNLGCQERVISGLDWVFSLVEEAIIFEDDCLPDPSFFPFCQELLARYRGDSRVASISGTNLIADYLHNTDASYFFSQIGGNWGWATWRSEWQRFDRHMEEWPELKHAGALSEIFEEPKMVTYWTRIFDDMYENNGRNAWDYQWLYTHLKNNSLAIVPRVNLVTNIGFGLDATHTKSENARLSLPTNPIDLPLRHPVSFIPLRSMDRILQDLRTSSITDRIAAKIASISKRIINRKIS